MGLDHTDLEIIKCLTENSKLTFKEIGEQIHLTGQAVGVRVNKMMEDGLIEKFTIQVNKDMLGIKVVAIIKIMMTTHHHEKVIKLIQETPEIVEAHRVSGGGCYYLKTETDGNDRLNEILDEINHFANYQLSLSISQVK